MVYKDIKHNSFHNDFYLVLHALQSLPTFYLNFFIQIDGIFVYPLYKQYMIIILTIMKSPKPATDNRFKKINQKLPLKSNNVEFVRYCGGHFENGDR